VIKSQTTITRLLRQGWTIEKGWSGYALVGPDRERKPVHASAVQAAADTGLIVRTDDRTAACGETWGLPPSLDSIRSNPKVESISDERVPGDGPESGGGNGIWAYLRPGWRCPLSDTHACHEWTVETLARAVAGAATCFCENCQKPA
jgi:hypothetical protein